MTSGRRGPHTVQIGYRNIDTAQTYGTSTKHWHGAETDAWLSHLAFITPGQGVSKEWLEPVIDEVYGKLPKNGANA
ncbi:hypothetical protein ACFWBM_23220 [Streptomyces sp. NPDC059980]|uniref:hypothetical protein n=1 Tax=Streptomyces sp. NPDC059980 TaxID=3347022 RepID=UPI0036C7044E